MIVRNCTAQTDSKGQELRQHGTALLPVACYHDLLARYPVHWHWHDELEAGVVLSGEILLSAGSQRLTLSAGDGFFVNSGVLHSAVMTSREDAELHSLVFHPRLVGGSVDSVFWEKYLLPLLNNPGLETLCLPRERDWGRAAVRHIEAAWQAGVAEGFGYEFTMRAELSALVLELTRHMQTGSLPPSEKVLRDNARMKQMLAFIQAHFSEEVTMEAIAASASVSKSECLRCFRSVVNTTPIQYLRQYRVQRAAELLRATDFKIAEIGAACGFQEMSYFARIFRETTGSLPSEYRKKAAARAEKAERG